MIYLLGGYMWLYVHRPFEVWPWLGTLQIERGYMILLLIAWLVNPNKGFTFTRMHAAIVLFLGAQIASYLMTPYGHVPGVWETVENSLKVFVFYCLMVTLVRDEASLRKLILFFLLANALYMGHSFYELLCGRYEWRMGVSRMVGVDTTYGDPNAFASTLLYTLPLLAVFWRERPRQIHGALLFSYAALTIFCILRTGSRAGFLALSIWTVLYLVCNAQQKIRALALCGLVIVVALGGMTLFMPEDLQNRYLTLIDSDRGPENARTSFEGRSHGFYGGFEMWGRSPLVGNGPATFAHLSGQGLQAHNLYGQVACELGLAGMISLALMVGFFFTNWQLAYRLRMGENDFAYQVARAVGFIVILLLLMGWAGHNLFRYNWQWFAAFQGIALHVLWMKNSAYEQSLNYQSTAPGLLPQGAYA
jgi:O-antigen ligase